mgnify:CR=1 FL=1
MEYDRIQASIRTAIAQAGPHKGKLKAKAPKRDSDAYAAWLALTHFSNPYKLNPAAILNLSPEQRRLYDAVTRAANHHKGQIKAGLTYLDRDRAKLEQLGGY